MNLTIYGPFRGVTGYDYLVRNFIQEMVNLGHNIQTIEFDRWSNTRGPTEIDALLEQTCNNNISPDLHLNFCLLDQTRINPNTANLVYTMFESNRICPSWIEASQKLEKVIVPTKFNFDSFAMSGKDGFRVSPDKLEICPLPLNINKLVNSEANFKVQGYDGLEFTKEYKHVFLNVSEYIPRKNLEGLIRAWIDETKPEDNACLLLKINSNFGFKLEFFGEKLKDLIKQKKCAPIYFLGDFLTETQMLALYRNCTHYISCSYGEGWGLSESICGVLGKRLVVPKSTAFSSYLDDNSAYLTMVQAVPAVQDGPTQQYYQNSDWYSPVMFSVKKMIRKSIKDANDGDLSKCNAVAPKLRALCDSRTVTQQLLDIAQNIQGSSHRSNFNMKEGKSIPNPVKTPNTPKEMNVGIFCKSIGSKCGIADYTADLYEKFTSEQNKNKLQVPMLANGYSCGYRSVLDVNDIHVVNLQLEYQFISPANLANFCSYCKNSNIKLTVTLHTVNPRCFDYHQVLIDYNVKVIVSSQVMADCLTRLCGIATSNVKVIPMGISDKNILNPRKIPSDSFRIGFFGFGYFHKGIDKLIRYMQTNGEGKDALILSTKPENDSGYFDKAINLANGQENVRWVTDHLTEITIARALSSCDLIFLPYSEYGGLATSAAIRTCLKAGVPIAAFDTCFFRDVINDRGLVKFVGTNPNNYAEWSKNLTEYIEQIKADPKLTEDFTNKRNEFVKDYSWDNIASRHLDYFFEVTK